jgi:hypothetical protein
MQYRIATVDCRIAQVSVRSSEYRALSTSTPGSDCWRSSTPCVGIDNLVLLCYRHHQLSHQPGWKITGTGAELEVYNPDGSVEVSRPPGAPPPADKPRAGMTGREPPGDNAHAPAPDERWATPWNLQPEQLTLA